MPAPFPLNDGDNSFTGVNSLESPDQLPAGFVSEAINYRFTSGSAVPRKGVKKIGFANRKNTSSNPVTGSTTSGSSTTNWTRNVDQGLKSYYESASLGGIKGIGKFQDPAGFNWILVAAPKNVYALRDGNPHIELFERKVFVPLGNNIAESSGTATVTVTAHEFKVADKVVIQGVTSANKTVYNAEHTVTGVTATTFTFTVASGTGTGTGTISAGVSIANSDDVQFVQCFNKVIMFRGEDTRPMKMTEIDEGFLTIPQEDSDTSLLENDSDGTLPIPNSNGGALFLQNRLFVIQGGTRDLIACSDFLNVSRFSPILASMRVNQGSDDALVALHAYDETTLLAFKEASIFAIRNVFGNLSDCFLTQISGNYGLAGPKAFASVGADVWFLSEQRGIASLSISESGRMQGRDVPVSSNIQDIIDRINWAYADKACAIWHNSRYYIAFPLDDSTVNNVICVFDFKSGAWSGYDTSTEINGIVDFVAYRYQGRRRLFFATDKFINLYDDEQLCGNVDEVVDTSDTTGRNITTSEIETSLTTRGYRCGGDYRKKFRASGVHINSNGVVGTDKGISATALFDGVAEETQILTNKNFSRTAYTRPFDKAEYVTTNVNDDHLTAYREDYSVAMAGSDAINPGTGIDPDRMQESTHKNYINGDGRYCQIKITNNVGATEITDVAVSAVPHDNNIIERR